MLGKHLVTRHLMILAAAAIVSLSLVAASGANSSSRAAKKAQPLTHVEYLLDFFANGTDAGFYVAIDKGFYKAEGLDVKISDGAGSASTAQAVAAGKYDFGTVAAASIVTAVAQGAPVKALANFYSEDGSGVLVNSKITKASDLEGKTIVGTNGLLKPLFAGYLKLSGVDSSKVKVVTVASNALLPTFLAGKADGCLCFSHSEKIRARSAGFDVNFLPFSASGLNVLGQAIVANTKTIAEKPDLVRRFVRASLKGWQYAFDNPYYAAGVMQKMVSSQGAFTSATTNVATLKAMKKLRWTKSSKGHPFGWTSRRDWGLTIKAMRDADALPADSVPSAAALFSNAFVPTTGARK